MSAVALASSAAAAIVAMPIVAIAGSTLSDAGRSCRDTEAPVKPSTGSSDTIIPSAYRRLYQSAGRAYGIDWEILAAIGYAESRHGQGRDAGIHSGHNQAGAMGPMQFLASSWRDFGVDGNGDHDRNVYDPADAIPSAANYLRRHGAPGHLQQALFAYNHSSDYVRLVLRQATRYASEAPPNSTCKVPPAQESTTAAAKAVSFAHAQLGKPYVWGAEGPSAYDCSGLTQRAYKAAGISLPRTTFDQWKSGTRISHGSEQPGDLIFFNSGPGSSPDRPGHVGIIISTGKMIAAPGRGSVVQIQTYRNRRDRIGFVRVSTVTRPTRQ